MSAVLFGSISTLADTSELQREAFNAAFAEHGLDWQWDRDTYRSLLDSNGGAARIADFAQQRGEEVDAAAVHETKSKLFRENLATADVTARPGVAETIKQAKRAGFSVGFVTTTSKDNVSAVLAAVDAGVEAADFDVVLSGDDVEAGKPDPAVYLLALDRLGETAAACVAVEDNPGGARAAAAAGIPCVAFPNENTAEQDFGGAPVSGERLDFGTLREATA